MTSEPDRVLIIVDDEGTYYAVPEALIRQGRIPAARRPALAGDGDGEDDVAGFLFCAQCGHAVRAPAPAPTSAGRRYRALAVTRLEPGARRLEMGGRL